MFANNWSGIELTVKGCAKAMKLLHLLSVSMITKMVSFPLDYGRASMKSILSSWDVCSRMGSG